ncbi:MULTISPECIES: hypothetical protein [Marinobacter]|jgi:acyl-CoA reductase-like NAD-dependent aldehyde dehydrogenase|uniref:Aldehyde dehydrogenase / Probable coniferyl aldehyde dehydrogenase n=1 Tax=Marinobacter excellens LAMA 842 TaxID=1306954 RepID=A0A137S1P5_9GAMM|nr:MULTISPECIES: hypothetical protein [Marinobacter]KXO06359.1 Aldehyde dehydrogenase / Probable coniferyl aldehyde dehydrogenase [Marinobacter excellens LAMA 842]MCD1632031.1 hypothetical protein [Marinobacter shengliensis]
MDAKTLAPREHVVRKLAQSFESQRRAYLDDPVPSRAERIQHLQALSRLVQDHQDAIVKAISDDFGNRSSTETLFCEIFLVLDGIKDTIGHLLVSALVAWAITTDMRALPRSRNSGRCSNKVFLMV